jgi:phosphatidylglycerophosphatase A
VSGSRPWGEAIALPLATLFGAGRSPVVPGTIGTLAALPIAVLSWRFLPVWGHVAATVALAGAGLWASGVAARAFGVKDPGPVVIDEAAGLMVTLAGIPFGWTAGALAFLLFRAMDVLKPPPARRLERLPGGWGIMLDDLAAGVYANLALRLAMTLWRATP